MNDYVPGQRRMGAFSIILISVVLSTAASVAAVRAGLEMGLLQSPVPAASLLDETRVPDVVGMPAAAADELLSARKLRMVVRERRPDESAGKDSVIEQSPLALSRVNSGSEVAVVVSAGTARPKVPEVLGDTLAEATSKIEQAGLALGLISSSENGEAGKVTAAVPSPGTEVAPRSAVALAVAQPKVEVPRLVGLHISKAREALEKAQLKAGSVSEIYDKRKKGYLVLSQDPDPGQRVEPGSEVRLVVNQGD